MRIRKTCLQCGKEFIAKTGKTKYCSNKCAADVHREKKKALRIKNVEVVSEDKLNSTPIPIINNKDILSVDEAAEYMGIGKSTVHRYCVAEKLKCIKINRRIFIRKQDIHLLFEEAGNYEVAGLPRKPITEFYTAREIAEKYNISKGAVHMFLKSKRVPMVEIGRVFHYSKTHVDRLYAIKQPDPEITEWYTVEEIMEKYDMKKGTAYSFVSENIVPKKGVGNKTYYSKKHVDALLSNRDVSEIDPEKWYSMADIVAKYDKEKTWVSQLAYRRGITKTHRGCFTYYLKEEFDREYEKMYPKQEWYSVEEIMEKYNLTQQSVYAFVKRYSIPTEKRLKNTCFKKSY